MFHAECAAAAERAGSPEVRAVGVAAVAWTPMPAASTCGHAVVWAVTRRNTPIPLDPEPHPDGGVAVCKGGPPVVRYLRGDDAPRGSEWRAMVHYESHPECRKWARKPVRSRAGITWEWSRKDVVSGAKGVLSLVN